VRLIRHSPWHKREPGGAHDRRYRLWDDSRSFLVLVAIGVASTSVKAATCKRGKKLAYNDAFCSGGEKLHSSGAKRIEAIKRSMREDFAVPEELKRKPYPA
jgi:hypothetical protein